MKTTTVDLFASALHFRPDGDVRAVERQMTSSDSGAWQIATFHVETDADVHTDYWEMHPEAEEAVCCLAGGLAPGDEGGPVDGEYEPSSSADSVVVSGSRRVRFAAGFAACRPAGRRCPAVAEALESNASR